MEPKRAFGGVFPWLTAGLLAAALAACGPGEPMRIGFLGGVSGRVADLGIGGRNGAMLAVELRNRTGGIGGRPVELVVEDDKQDPAAAAEALQRLRQAGVEAIVGPMTSAMALAVVPLANEARLLLVSPTVTTPALSGIDDYFLRVIAPTTEYAHKSASHHFHRQGSRRVAAAYDVRNLAYTESWLNDYRKAFSAAGGVVAAALPFRSGEQAELVALADKLVAERPDSVLILANSVDAALLAQLVRKRDAAVRVSTSEWSATERLLELGGQAIEGMVVAQFVDRDSSQPAYLAFRKAYRERYGQEPGYPGLTGFDAANVVLDGLAARKAGQGLKEAILSRTEFAGAQSAIRFTPDGDAARETYLTEVRNGAFVRLRGE
jgi:branched-chain amino acid transport system substrate-binding protein